LSLKVENEREMSDKTRALLLVLIQFILFAVLGGVLLFLPAGQVVWVRLLGLAVAAIGLIVIAVALLNHVQVNRALVSISPEPDASLQLVEIGLYHWIRHPLYLGAILAAFGVALAHGHIASIAVAALVWLFFTYKSAFEERWLVHVYPGYPAYRQRTGRFLPRL
jgi:protein-S-isoprenylcysteine O-methyltransferase Ste14